MRKIAAFYEAYFKEICFIGFMVFLTLCTILSEKNGTEFITVNAVLLATAFCSGIFFLVSYADRFRIGKLYALTTFGIIAVFGSTVYFCSDHFELYGQAALLSLMICYVRLFIREAEIRKREAMSSDENIRLDVKKGYELTEQQQLQVLNLPDAEKLVYSYLRYYNLVPVAEISLLDKSWSERFMRHDKAYEFSDEACAHMFNLPNASDVVKIYVENGHTLHEDLLMNIFGLPNAAEIMAEYVTLIEMPLPEDIELKMLALPNAKELISIYRRKFDMHDDATKIAQAKGFI